MEEYQDRSLGGKVFQQIRSDIINGKYKENDELRENTIGKELGVSRTPVREALRQLELEGLVSIIPNRGAFVTGISHKDIKDIYLIRSLLEGLCARWAAENISEEKLTELEEIIVLSEFQINRENVGSPDHITALDGRFLLTDFHNYVKMARLTSVASQERARRSIREHRQILRAIRERDGELAEQLANEHIMHVIENLKTQGF